MTPRFRIEATKEIVLIKPNGVMEFRGDSGFETTAPITFSSETAALEYAKNRGWKEVPLAV